MTSDSYHLLELRIAKDPSDPRRNMPSILEADRAILDVGCGAGQTLIASHLPAGVLAAGVDTDKSALSLGRGLNKGIRLICAKGECLPFQAEYFDLVFSRVAVPYMDIHRALSEMFRVLKVGGRLWIVLHPWSRIARDLVTSCRELNVRGIVSRLIVIGNGLVLNLTDRTLPLPFSHGRTESFQTRRAITRLLRRIGFEDVKIEQTKFFTVTARKASPQSVEGTR